VTGSIGQGETTVSPLQLAVAYSALVNGGRIWEPTLGWAVVGGDGKVRVRAVTQWAIIDKAAGRPIRVPPEVVAPFMEDR